MQVMNKQKDPVESGEDVALCVTPVSGEVVEAAPTGLFARMRAKLENVFASKAEARLKAGEMDTDENRVIRFGMITLWCGLGGFLLWAALAPLDEGVPGMGVVGVESKRKTVQHLRGGIVQEILVRDGDLVEENAPLIRLNDTEVKAQYDIAQGQYAQVQAMTSRLLAERDNAASVKFPQTLLDAAKSDTRAADAVQAQSRLFAARRAVLDSEMGAIDESIRGLNEQIAGLSSLEVGKKTQIDLINKELDSYRSLVEEGFVPRNKIYDLERVVADLSGTRGSDLAQVGRAQAAISEMRLRRIQRQQDFRREVEAHLSDAQREESSLQDKLKALSEEYERAVIRAPIAGHVVGMEVNTVGGVIRGSERLLDIVPQGDVLLVEAQLPVNLINKVQVGQLANIHFQIILAGGSAPTIEGKLIQVSADRITEPRTGHPYYAARIEITPKGEADMRKYKIIPQPGMQTDVVVLTGERTFLQYLVKPLTSRLALGMKEQ